MTTQPRTHRADSSVIGTAHWSRRILGAVLSAALAVTVMALVPAPAQAATFVSSTPDRSWRVDGRVLATVIVGNTVFVGGNFSRATSPTGTTVTRNNLAAFTMDTGELMSGWQANTNGPVRALVTDGTSLFLGGNFSQVGGQTRYNLAKVAVSNGAVNGSFTPNVGSRVNALELVGDDLYVGGFFTLVNGQPKDRVAKLSASTGAVNAAFGTTLNGPVYGISKNPTTDVLYLVGDFNRIQGATRAGVGAVNASTGSVTNVAFTNSAQPSFGVDTNDDGTRVYVAGGSGSNAMASWNTVTGVRMWRVVTDGDNQVVRHFRGMVYFGFHDGYLGDTRFKALAVDAATGVVDQSWMPVIDQFWGVFAIDVSVNGLVLGGEFTRISGVPAQGWARFRNTGDPPPPPPVTTRYADSLTAWSYWDQGTRPTNWETEGFNDSTWPTGSPQLGYGDGDETTVISYGPSATNKYITSYFRTRVAIDALPETAAMNLLADDGAVVYVNGTEVIRDNMPTGTITNTTRASTGRSGGDENAMRYFEVPLSVLRVGTNTVAVEVHQDYAGSSDLSFDMDFFGQTSSEETEEPPPPPPPPDGEPVESTPITNNESWRYSYLPTQPPASWTQVAFDDSAWNSGLAVLGWGHSTVVTRIDTAYASTSDRPLAAYFRKTFQIADASKVSRLVLTTVSNDGVVIYVNGTEVARENMPSGTVTINTYAVTARNTATANANPIVVEVPLGLLRTGTNVVAAETHLNYRATRDVTFDLRADQTTNP